MTKTIFLMLNGKDDISIFTKAIEKTKTNNELFILGSGVKSDTTFKNAVLSQSNFIIAEDLEEAEAKTLAEQCPDSMIIILANDVNRAQAVVSYVENLGKNNINFVDKLSVDPAGLCQILDDFEIEVFEQPTQTQEVKQEPKTDENATEMSTEDFLKSAEAETVVAEPKQVETLQGRPVYEEPVEQKGTTTINLRNVSTLRNKCITVFSRQGGAGVTTVAKELANIYSKLRLPKAFASSQRANLKVCLLDFDFENGGIRTVLGFNNPIPNIYSWISDIVTKVTEQQMPLSKVRFNKLSIMENYVQPKTEDRPFSCVITNQGEIPAPLLQKLTNISPDAVCQIAGLIISELKKTFDVLIIDAGTTLNEFSTQALIDADNVIYLANPTVYGIEQFHVFLKNMKDLGSFSFENLGLVFSPITNKNYLWSNIPQILDATCKIETYDFEAQKQLEKSVNHIGNISFNEDVININNQYAFISDTTSKTKNELKKIAMEAYDIFKTSKATLTAKYTPKQLKALEMKKRKEALKKQKQEALKKQKGVKPSPSKPSSTVSPSNLAGKEEALAYLKSDLRKVTFKDFMEKLNSFVVINKIEGVPILRNRPPRISSKVWREYQKLLKQALKKKALAEKEKKKSNKKASNKTVENKPIQPTVPPVSPDKENEEINPEDLKVFDNSNENVSEK